MNVSIENKIINWIRGQVKNAGAKGVVIGLSGGIDSSLAAVLCKKAVGNNMMGLIMPCHSPAEDVAYALLISDRFDIKVNKINLTSIYDWLIDLCFQGDKISLANVKPRLRMTVLYYYANNMNYLVCGTGNKSEIMTGYFTKYGDGGADILPLGNFYKTQVRRLAKSMKIPQRIIDKPPSAGLWDGQTDEGEMGISYKDLDELLLKYEKGERISGKKAGRVLAMMKKARHKLNTPLK